MTDNKNWREWRDASNAQEKYLVQLMPPGDIITEVIRTIVSSQNITSAAIVYDDSFGNHRKQTLIIFIGPLELMYHLSEKQNIHQQFQ